MTSKEKQEERSSHRFCYASTIMFVNPATGYYLEGRMLNYSSEGMYFESDFPVEPKANIYFGIQKSPYSLHNGFHRANVIWCQALSDSKSGFHYGIGISYDEQAEP
jgi:hypothetical protein